MLNFDLNYKAAVLLSPGNIQIRNLKINKLEKDEVIVRVSFCTLCPTDIRKYSGTLKIPAPLILGHEVSGIVESKGIEVRDLREGDKVAVLPMIPCGYCRYCILGLPELCDNLVGIGASAGSLDKCAELLREKEWGGGFAEYVKVPRNNIIKLNENVPVKTASLMEPLANVIRAQTICSPSPSKIEAIFGGGPIGLLHLIAAKNLGVSKVLLVEPIQERRELALEYGASQVINPNEENPVEEIRRHTDGFGADIVIVTVGGKTGTKCIEMSIDAAAKNGRIILFASSHPSTYMNVDPNTIHYKELRLIGSFAAHPIHFFEAINLISQKSEELNKLIYPTMNLENISEAFHLYGKPGSMKIAIEP